MPIMTGSSPKALTGGKVRKQKLAKPKIKVGKPRKQKPVTSNRGFSILNKLGG